MSQVTRPLLATLSLVVLWFLAMSLEGLRAPVSALAVNAGLILVNLIVLVATIHQATREPDRPDGGGGLRPDRPEVPEAGGGGEPTWWPAFERELAQYLAEHARDDPAPHRVPVGS